MRTKDWKSFLWSLLFCMMASLTWASDWDTASDSIRDYSFQYSSDVANYLERESQWRSQMYEPRSEMEQGDRLKVEAEDKTGLQEVSSSWNLGAIDIEWLIWFIVGVIVLIILIAMFIILSQTSVINKKVEHRFVDEDFDSLHADEDLKQVLEVQNYNEAIRIVYLRTLVWLEKCNMIKWEKSKTAIEYYYELTSEQRKEPLRELTQIFLKARYDDVVADMAMYEKAAECSEQICTGR